MSLLKKAANYADLSGFSLVNLREIRALCGFFSIVIDYRITVHRLLFTDYRLPITMIDWTALLVNSLWILGAAVLLAAFSYHYWQAQVEGTSVRAQLERPSFSRPFWVGFVLISLGLAGTSNRWWETAVWVLFTVFSLFNLYTTCKKQSHE